MSQFKQNNSNGSERDWGESGLILYQSDVYNFKQTMTQNVEEEDIIARHIKDGEWWRTIENQKEIIKIMYK